jgi:Mn2+/Fe2+ NRAMP family transporter
MKPGWVRALLATGPGLVVMLADTDAGSVLTAAQSGAQYGYRLLVLQAAVIPVLFIVQELTIRLGIGTGRGHGELIAAYFGPLWARLSVATLVLSCFGAVVTEMSGLAGIGEMFGLAAWQIVLPLVVLIFLMILSATYRAVELVAILFGLGEIAFLIIACASPPQVREITSQIWQMPLGEHRYLYLLAANLGTSVMPWAVFYQQSAIVDKRLDRGDLRAARLDTLGGAVLCQAITVAVLIGAAASFGGGAEITSVRQVGEAFALALGSDAFRIIFAIGLGGGALVATIVVCLTAAWTMGEVTGLRHSLADQPAQAPWFYLIFGVLLLAGAALVLSGVNLVGLSIGVGVLNSLLLPVVLWGLYRLARTILPDDLRLRGPYAVLVALVFVLTAGLGLIAGLLGSFG